MLRPKLKFTNTFYFKWYEGVFALYDFLKSKISEKYHVEKHVL